MQLARFKSDRLRWAVLLVSIGTALHFAVSCLIWSCAFVAIVLEVADVLAECSVPPPGAEQ